MYDIYAYIYIYIHIQGTICIYMYLYVFFFILESYTKLPGLCTRYVFFKKMVQSCGFLVEGKAKEKTEKIHKTVRL